MVAQPAPIRDAIIAGEQAMMLEYQRRSRVAAAQSDVLRATDEYADELLDERQFFRQATESTVDYRARALARAGTVDPNDIIAAANAILAPFTSISCRYEERSDGMFLTKNVGGLTPWSCHLFKSQDLTTPATDPNYPDRNYPIVPLRRPRGARPNGDIFGRWFLLRCPDVSSFDTTVLALNKEAPADGSGFFLTKGDGIAGGAPFGGFLFEFASSSSDLYNAIIGSVTALIGEGIRWTLLVDSNLQP